MGAGRPRHRRPAPPVALLIRAASEDDLPAITAILNAGIATRAATAQLEPVDVDDRRAWLRAHDARRPVWVAADADGAVGWCSITPWSDRAAYAATAEVSVYVALERQRQGIGAALLRHALATAPALGIDTYVARVFTHNAASLRLFERFDFAWWGVMRDVARLDGIRRSVAILGRPV